jgi:tetratricopeptide (TPR) repeat protein
MAEGIALQEDTLKRRTAALGADHPDTLQSLGNLAEAYRMARRLPEAIALNEEALRRKLKVLGADHPHTLSCRNNLAVALADAGRSAEAVAMHEGALRRETAALGADHPDTLNSRNNLAVALLTAGRAADAAALHEETLRRLTAVLGPDHPDTLMSRGNLAWAYEALDRRPEAEALRREVVAGFRKASPRGGTALASALAGLGTNLLSQRKWAEAEPVLRECLAVREKVLPDDWSRFNTTSQLGGALAGQGRYAEAEPLVVAGYEGMKAREARIPLSGRPRLSEAAARLVPLFEALGRPDAAASWRARLAASETLPADPFQH